MVDERDRLRKLRQLEAEVNTPARATPVGVGGSLGLEDLRGRSAAVPKVIDTVTDTDTDVDTDTDTDTDTDIDIDTGIDTGLGTGADGAVTFTATDGTVFNDEATYKKYQELLGSQESIADTRRREGESAYNILFKKFSEFGLGGLVEAVQGYIVNGLSEDELTLRLRETPAYQTRFSANKDRIARGLSALSEAAYIKLEDQYQEVMRQYGLPDSYWAKQKDGKQPSFEQLIANDISNTELEDRLLVAQDRVLKANPEVLNALKQFYPDIKNGDILAYTLDPKNAIKNIQSKVTAAEIGGAAMAQGLTTGVARAEQLAGAGVTKAAAQQGFETVAGMAPRGSQLASIYREDPYTQQTAETEIFNLAGSAEAKRRREKLTSLETASFSGQSGRGAIDRERAGQI
jgi:hypothetical protein